MVYTDTDRGMHDAVLDALRDEPRIDAGKVSVAVEGGVVTLSGTLGSFTEKWAAENAVRGVRGVRGIANELRVDLPGMHVRDDADIAKTVVEVLQWSDALPKTIVAEVHDGYVTLHGTVDWAYQRQDAMVMARRIAGVKGVYSDIAVKPKDVDPAELRRNIASRFQRLAAFDAKGVEIDVRAGGFVKLTGSVASLAECDEAESAAYAAAGTTEVRNELRVADDGW
jgi:osmotically-inducible protein OsmY